MHPVHLHSLRLHCSIHTQVTMRWTHYHFGLAGLLCTSPPGYLVYSYVSVSFKNNINSHLFFPGHTYILNHLLIRHLYVYVYRHLKVSIQARTNELPLQYAPS